MRAVSDIEQKYVDIVIPMLNLTDKLILTGGLSLQMLGIVSKKSTSDIDFGLRSMLNIEEFTFIRDFFDLKLIDKVHHDGYSNEDVVEVNPSAYDYSCLKQDRYPIRLGKTITNPENKELLELKVDIFTEFFLEEKDIINLQYDKFNIRIAHPYIPLSMKARYAFDSRVNTSMKHYIELSQLFTNKEKADAYYLMINHLKVNQLLSQELEPAQYRKRFSK